MDFNDNWLPIISYANQSGLSISTIRRHIKSGQLVWRLVDGKYFIRDQEPAEPDSNDTKEIENIELKKKLKKLSDEINDLKTLIMLYESNDGHVVNQTLPELPGN